MTIELRPLRESELREADGIYRRAFGTLRGLADPLTFEGDAERVRCRWAADPDAAIALLEDGVLAGTSFVSRWGSVGLFGPLAVDPPRQGRGLAHPLVEEALRLLDRPQVALRGLYTSVTDPRTVGLYQRHGYWPMSLAVLMQKTPVAGGEATAGFEALSRLSPDAQAEALSACRELADQVFDGLDVTGEILSVGEQETGDTVLLREGSRLGGFAVCHAGKGSEAGSGRAAVRFGVVPSGEGGEGRLRLLLDAVEAWAAAAGATVVTAGTGSGRVGAWQTLRAAGWLPFLQGVAMHHARHPGYDLEDVFILDDWR